MQIIIELIISYHYEGLDYLINKMITSNIKEMIDADKSLVDEFLMGVLKKKIIILKNSIKRKWYQKNTGTLRGNHKNKYETSNDLKT